MVIQFLRNHDALVFVFALLWVILAAAELGFRFGRRHRRANKAAEGSSSGIEGAMLSLLSLLLAFGVSMAVSRYEARVEGMLEEQNEIGTAYLRADLFGPAFQAKVKEELRAFLDARIRFYFLPNNPEDIASLKNETDRIVERIWNLVIANTRDNPRSSTDIVIINSINGMFDMRDKEEGQFQNLLPISIPALLSLSGALVVALVGYGHGLGGRRHFAYTLMLSTMIVGTLFVMLDLNRPRRGWIRVDPRPLAQLRADIDHAA